MPDEEMRKTLEELSPDLQESKAGLEEAQRIAQVGEDQSLVLRARSGDHQAHSVRSWR
jgi:hypothetical protein